MYSIFVLIIGFGFLALCIGLVLAPAAFAAVAMNHWGDRIEQTKDKEVGMSRFQKFFHRLKA